MIDNKTNGLKKVM